jgi:signal transduction histidine kinase
MAGAKDSWRRSLRDLYNSFERSDRQLELLRSIDRSIVDQLYAGLTREASAAALEKVFSDSLEQLTSIHQLNEPGRCYVYVGDELLPLAASGASEPQLPVLKTPKIVQSLIDRPGGEEALVIARGEGNDDLFDQLDDARTVLVQPVYEGENLFAVLVFPDDIERHGSRLVEPEVETSVDTVARQLAIAYSHYRRAEEEKQSSELWRLFIDSNLAPTACFQKLAQIARTAYLGFGPLKLSQDPEVQILTVEYASENKDPLFLTIRGTTGEEPVNTKIKIDLSISGFLVRKDSEELPLFCDDPTKSEYGDIYRSYLGKEVGSPIRTELAVRLVAPDGNMVGVLNFESGIENAFNLRHRVAILDFADRVARMVQVFEDRIEHNRIMQLSVSSVTSNYLDSLAGIFRHGIASPLLAIRGEIDAVDWIVAERLRPAENGNGELSADIENLGEALTNLDAAYGQLREYATDFGEEISGFGASGCFDLHELIEETVSLARRSYLAKAETKIAIRVGGVTFAPAFCTRLFKQHFFSVLTNAIYSLREKATTERGERHINVTIERHEGKDASQEVELNTGWLIRVRDDGVGVDEETLQDLREFRPGTHRRKELPGTGLGLAAMQRYMGSVGGWIELDGKEGEFFEVRLLLDEYREEVHGPMSAISKGGVEDGT